MRVRDSGDEDAWRDIEDGPGDIGEGRAGRPLFTGDIRRWFGSG